ncbi:probable calcium-binding protein CML41 [Syzygium oleosum]|uniref:probable calcium-binding protein CML41 n=1 Tax=Syzygium oleosum TaxID=219896 RepID=UPI0024BAA2AC|nr:probable calcium-binding protein CML41 [Syzygium oleosum]
MAAALVLKPSKWLVSRSLKLLKLPRNFHSKPKSPNAPSLPSPSTNTSRDIENKYLQAFKRFDRNGDGKMSGEELSAFFESIGESLPHREAQKVIADFDSDGDGLLKFEDFVSMMEQDGGEADDDLKRVFEMFEADKGCGGITARGLQHALSRIGEREHSYEECVSMIRAFDLDGNGVVDFQEFQRMMTSN